MNHRILIVEDKLLGYELGADDYVTKPFSMSVLYAKVSALIRRSRGNMLAGDVLEDGGGTGLGLAIARNIIELHGGRCFAYNTEKGVAFGFTI